MPWNRLLAFLVLAVVSAVPPAVHAQLKAAPGDWPQWRGPDRTGVSTETGLLKKWPEGGPKLLWKATGLGGGYASPSVAKGRIFLLGSKDNEEYLFALDVKDGHEIWSVKVGLVGKNRGPNYPGPRSTPTVDGDLLYALGSDGDLVCAEVATGKFVWRRHLVKDFQGNRGVWAYAESPLIDGEVLVITPGGPTHTMVTLNKKTGDLLWKLEMEYGNGADYSSAIVVEAAGVKQYVQFLGPGVIGVSAKEGKLLWRYRKNVGGQSCMTPIFHDGCVFTSASGTEEGAGGDALLRLEPSAEGVKATEVYLHRHVLNHHGGVVRVGDYLYGCGGSGLVCLDFKTGAVKWNERSIGRGSLIVADGHVYLRGERGAVALIEATPDGYKEKGRFQQPDRSKFPTFQHPVVAGGRLYLRDEGVLFCYDVKEK
jgi:outer membrane protein assembly factor BamB